jgi:hypothetical protein
MDNATRRQILERVKQLGYPNTIEALQNPQILDQYEQQLQAQSQQQQQQQPIQQQQPVTFPTPPATTPNYKAPQPAQSEAKPLVMSFNETAPQLMKTGGIKLVKGGPKDEETGELETEALRNKFYQTAPNLQKLYADLNAEKERVAQVRANVPIEANKLDDGDNFRHSQGMGEDLKPYNAYLTAKTPKELEEARQSLSPRIKSLLVNEGKYNVAQWDANKKEWNAQAHPGRELYCTPYGCYTYQLAGATDVPIVPGNMGFQSMAKQGKIPFEKVTTPEQGDVGLVIGEAPINYTKPELGKTDRPHHTVIYDKGENDGTFHAWNAYDGQRLNFTKSHIKLEPDVKDSPMKSMEYYRYVGDTNKLQKQIDAEYKAHPELLDIENQIKLKQEQIKSQPIQTIKPLDMKPIRVSKQEIETLSLKKYGGSKFEDGGFFTDPPPKKVEPTLPVVQAQALSTAVNPTGAEIFARDNALQVAQNLNALPENPPAYYPSDAYISGLRLQENAGKSGFNKNNNKWYSHASVEGGTNTIAYGHKLTKEEAAKGIYSKGITEEQANALLKKDLENHLNNAKKVFNSKYGENAFDKVPNELKDVLVDYSYNGVLNKFNNFTQGVYNYSTAATPEQKELAHQQMLKEYQRKAGDKLLTGRNTWTKEMLESVPTRKYGGKKCYTCNSSKMKVLYNKAKYKK